MCISELAEERRRIIGVNIATLASRHWIASRGPPNCNVDQARIRERPECLVGLHQREPLNLQGRRPTLAIDLEARSGYLRSPEKAIWVDAGLHIDDLGSRTGNEEIHSHEGKGTDAFNTVGRYVVTFHGSNVELTVISVAITILGGAGNHRIGLSAVEVADGAGIDIEPHRR